MAIVLKDLVEQFPMELVTDPSAHLSTDPRDVYNNILLFIVQEDKRRGRSVAPTEMHIFQVFALNNFFRFSNSSVFLNLPIP